MKNEFGNEEHAKPYSEELHDEYRWTEDEIHNKIDLDNYNLIDNPEKKGIDKLIVDSNGNVEGGIDVESHGKYWHDEFPFSSVHFLVRKEKFVSDEMKNYYILVNDDMTDCCMMSMNELIKYRKIRNKVSTEGKRTDIFWDVPNDDCTWGWDSVNKKLNEVFNNE